MYFSGGINGYEERKCPQCGTLLTNPNKHAPYNANFRDPGPYFCSASCFDKLLQPRFKRLLPPPKSLDEETQREIQKLREEAVRMAGVLTAYRGDNFSDFYEAYQKEDDKLQRKIESLERRPKVNSENEIKEATKEAINELQNDWWRGWEEWVTAENKKDDEKYRREHPIINAVSPLYIDENIKFDHTLCLAPSGAGKTTLMFHEILENLKKPDPPAMVIIDPKGTVLREISSLGCFHPINGVHKDRLVIIDPSDLGGPPAFNLFKPTSAARLERYDLNSRAVLENKVVELLQYTFSSRNQPLTGKQAPCFTAVCRLLLKLPNPTFSLLLDVLNDQQSQKKQSFEDCPWKDAINQLPEISARFFREQYYENYTSTRHEITSRLYGILEHPAIQSVFNTQENRFDMFDAIQRGKIVIVNVPFALLTSAGAELFGRYMIASTLAASFERVTIRDKSKWKPAFLYIDESQEFADENKTPELLRLAREFKLGVFLCLQDLASLEKDSLKSAVLTNTRVKYASSLEVDASAMSKGMNCEPSLFHQTHATPSHVRFACFVRGLTKTPAIIELPKGAIDKEPHLTDDVYEEVLSINRKRVSTNAPDGAPQERDAHPARVSPPDAAPVHSPPSQPSRASPEHDDDAAPNWS